jgi:hypothetical protein
VLSLVREGLSNPQIGERLGISADAAKYHVSEILSKLGVATREEAAAWQPEPAEVEVLRPAWARALGRWWPALAWAGAAAVLIGVGLLLLGVLLTNGDDGGSVTETGTGTATATSTATQRPASVPISIGDSIDVPENMELIIETGCWSCDGFASSLVRVYRGSGGNDISDKLVDAAQLGGASFRSTLFDPFGRRLFLVVCMAGDCGGLGPATSDAREEAFESTDGGVTWQDKGDFPLEHFPVAFSGESIMLSQTTAPGSNENPSAFHYVYQLYPGGDTVSPPNGDDTARPFSTDSFEVIWVALDGRLLRPDGTLIAQLPRDRDTGQAAVFSVRGDMKAGLVVGWVEEAVADVPNHFTQINIPPDDSPARVTKDYTTSGGIYQPAALLTKQNLLIANGYTTNTGQQLPSLIDENDVAHPIAHPFTDADFPYQNQRNLVDAVMGGPFAKVKGTGSCLNVREVGAADAQVLECVADGVLLEDLGAMDQTGRWLEVLTPSRKIGYASMDFLELIGTRQ